MATKHRLRLKKETKHTAVYESDDPLAPCTLLYVQKSWLATEIRGREGLVVSPEVTVTVERVDEVQR